MLFDLQRKMRGECGVNMRVLMFGWEFPPFITGGLGTACHGLTKELSHLVSRIVFVVPRIKATHSEGKLKLVGASEFVQTTRGTVETVLRESEMLRVVEVPTLLQPYMSAEGYSELHRQRTEDVDRRYGASAHRSVLSLSGDYGHNLFDEVMRYATVAAQIALSEPFDVIHAHDWMTCLAGIEAKRATGLPLVLHVHALEFDRCGENIDERVYALEKHGMEQADLIIAVSNRTRNLITSRYHIDPRRVRVIHNGITPLDLHVPRRTPSRFPEKLVVFLGRVTMQKGPEYFLEAAYLVLRSQRNVRFVMAGAGDMLPRMIMRMAELGIGDRFHFTGHLTESQRSQLLSQASLFVMSSVSEPFGLTPIEALQHQVPVIVTKQSGASEVLTHAIKVDFWDTHKMADAIIKVLSEPGLATSLVEGGQHDLQAICWKRAAQSVYEIYEEVS